MAQSVAASSPPVTKHLHPMSLVFELVQMVRGNVIPTVAALLSARSGSWIGLAVGGTIVTIGFTISLIRYLTFRYCLRDGELVIHQGLLDRLHRTVPLDRIQNIDLSQNLFHRMFRVGEVRVETGSGQEPEAVMRVLAIAEYNRLKEELSRHRQSQDSLASVTPSAGIAEETVDSLVPVLSPAIPFAQPTPATSQLILAMPTRLIVIAGLLSNRGEVIAGVVFATLWQLRFGDKWIPGVQLDFLDRKQIKSTVRSFAQDSGAAHQAIEAVQSNLGALGSISLLILGIAILFAILRVFSAVWYILKFYGYRLELREKTLHVQCGLLTQVSATIPLGRVQLISVQRSWLARYFGLASICIETAGGGQGKDEESASSIGRKWFVPVVDYQDVPRILAAIDSRIEFNEANIQWSPLSKNAVQRMLRPTILLAILLFCVGLYLRPTWGWIPGVAFGILGYLYVRKKAKSRRYARTDWGILYRSGSLKQKCSMTFFEKIQSAKLSQSPFDSRWNMQTISVDTASAGPADHTIQIKLLDSQWAAVEFEQLQSRIPA